MPEEKSSVREIQDHCAYVAVELETLAHRLVRLREGLRLPPDALAIYEDSIPWPVELEVDAAIGAVIDDDLSPAAERLRKASRVTAEMLRQRHLARSQADQREEAKP